ncbi:MULTISPECIES: hypothetical protein [Lacticaseibacillus]|uniref:hypothetical protein n=1 Tax=Lacticaseibacillus TaxID=2759736 RepID=UPI00063D8D9F|nr:MULTISPECIES: hypothetical protein [Lacticaseibacillus]KLI76086.1 hypothetical protein AAW28_02625 [Lacticaseibacillus casei]
MKKGLLTVIAVLSILFTLTACGSAAPKPDYTEAKAESALNAGKDLKGKTVQFKVKKIEPNSAFGFNLEAGKHLNFVSEENPKVKKGHTVIVKVKKAASTLGSWVITYTDLKK